MVKFTTSPSDVDIPGRPGAPTRSTRPPGRDYYNNAAWAVKPNPPAPIVIMVAGRPRAEEQRVRRKYPWEEWFDQSCFVLVRGVHYHCSQVSMAQMVRNRASAKGLRLRITDNGSSLTVEVTGERYSNAVTAVPHTDTAPVVGQH